jgi:hypothetical protein
MKVAGMEDQVWADFYTGHRAQSFRSHLSMMTILIIAIYLSMPLVLLGMRRLKAPFRACWLAALLVNLALWTAFLILRLAIPETVTLAKWESQGVYEISLLLDTRSWALGIALATLNLAGLLTDLARPVDGNELNRHAFLAAGTGLTGLGLLAVLSANTLTLVLAWLAIDMAELVICIPRGLIKPTREQVVITSFMRITGSFVVITAFLYSGAGASDTLSFENLSPQTNLLLLTGAALRLGLFPFFPPRVEETDHHRGLGNSLRFVVAASIMILVARIADYGGVNGGLDIVLLFTSLTAIYSALRWFYADGEISGRFYWVTGMGSLAFASAALGQPGATLAWCLAALFPGGMLMQASLRNRLTLPLAFGGTILLSTLPLTPTWNGLMLYAPPFHISYLFLLAAQSFLLAGYARHFFTPTRSSDNHERWVWAIYVWGLLIVLLIYLVVSYWLQLLWSGPTGAQLLPLIGVVILAGIAGLIAWRNVKIPGQWVDALSRLFSLKWLIHLGMTIYRSVRRMTSFVSLILEGEGGILWSLLFLVLLLSALLGAGSGR